MHSLNWNLVRRHLFLSGSWDDSVKLWDVNAPGSVATFKEHTYCVYAAVWCGLAACCPPPPGLPWHHLARCQGLRPGWCLSQQWVARCQAHPCKEGHTITILLLSP